MRKLIGKGKIWTDESGVRRERIIIKGTKAKLLNAIEVAGRIVGQVQDRQFATNSERDYALSRASDALGGTYFKATGQALKWWEYEPTARLEDYLRKAKGEVS